MNAEEIARIQGKVQPGARRKKARLKPTQVMLYDAERQELDGLAQAMNKSRSALIREAVCKVLLKKKA